MPAAPIQILHMVKGTGLKALSRWPRLASAGNCINTVTCIYRSLRFSRALKLYPRPLKTALSCCAVLAHYWSLYAKNLLYTL